MELKPCPFCGEEPRVERYLDEDIWTHNTVDWVKVVCPGCEISTSTWPESVAKEEVYNVWNRRVNND